MTLEGYSEQKLRREAKFFHTDEAEWDIILMGQKIGSMQRERIYSNKRYKLFDKNDQFLGIAKGRMEAKMIIAINYIGKENIIVREGMRYGLRFKKS